MNGAAHLAFPFARRSSKDCRVASVLSDRIVLPSKLKPYQIAARVLLERMKAVAAYMPLTEVTLVIEESSRDDSQAKRYLDDYKLTRLRVIERLIFRLTGSSCPKQQSSRD
jgi:hypothetical protein